MADINEVIHTPARLRIMTTLNALPDGDRLSFPRLRALLDMTAGNLSTHLNTLQSHDYVQITKVFERSKPVTYLALTPTGRAAYQTYLVQLRRLLDGGTENS